MLRVLSGVGILILAATACGGDDSANEFDAEAWRIASVERQASGSMGSTSIRCQMVDQISDVLSAGMTVDEVTAQLGQQNMTVAEDRLSYRLGVCGASIDPDYLWIILEGGQLTEWRVVQG